MVWNLTEPLRDARPPLWPYTWGRIFRCLSFPLSLLYRFGVTRTVVLGADNLTGLPPRVILAGTHHGFPDLPLVRCALGGTPARGLSKRLIVVAAAEGFGAAGLVGKLGILALGLYPIRQYSDRDVSLRGLAQSASAGNPVLIFAQGTHAWPEEERADDPRVRFKPGVSHLAAALDAVVVPFGLAGTEQRIPAFLDDCQGRPIAGVPLSITRGPLAIAFEAPLSLGPDESVQAFAERLQEISYALTRQAEQALTANPAGTVRSPQRDRS